MSSSNSGNAIIAKAHTLYGKRLNAEDYNKLLQKRTLAEITGFLKNETYYSEALSGVKEELVHREQLELMVRRREFEIYIKLRKYTDGDDVFFTMYRMKNEISQLLLAMRLLNADAMKDFIISLPVYLTKHLSFDLFEVARATSYDDLLAAIQNTGYYNIIGKFRPVSRNKHIDIPACENALLTYYYTKIKKTIEKRYPPDIGKFFRNIFNYQVDFHNISMIFRMKRYFGASGETIAKYIIPVKTKYSTSVYKELLDARDIHDADAALKRFRASKLYPDEASISSERVIFLAQKNKMQMMKHLFRFSNIPAVSVICYMLLLEIEVDNIVNIIEGARYGLSPEKIRAMLVIAN